MAEEKFEIEYYYMGQGDCILIACPDIKRGKSGPLIMIDCGSSKGLGANNEDLLLRVCTGVREITKNNGNKIDILILTHKDRDHYNQVIKVFADRDVIQPNMSVKSIGAITIGTVYYSSPPNAIIQYALGSFSESGVGNSITGGDFKTQSIRQVFINNNEQKMMEYTSQKSFKISDGIKTKINKNRHTVVKGTTVKKVPWSVSIIAGHVPPESNQTNTDDDAKTNPLSLVTLLEIGKPGGLSRGLFLGDATVGTEEFLLKKHKSLIKDVDFVHIPHHGSETSSDRSFVKNVNPKGAEVTHETYETGFKLPKSVVLERWLDVLKSKARAEEHVIDYWKKIKEADYNSTLKYWQDKKIGYHDVGNGDCYLLHPPDNYVNRYIYISKKIQDRWGLYRARTQSNLWGTGATGSVRWTLPPE
jgi:beta-lactamase superfamily II metal-dependent hydrolase